MNVYKVLAGLDFSGKLFETKAQTALGNELINKYRTIVVANPATCGTVNNFLREARGLSYDSGVQALVETIGETLAANRYGWALASVCENIENGGNKHSNYLQMRALEQVRPMLEMKEEEIVSYIKSGALKDVMYVESFRNIARAIYREQPVVEYSDQFTTIHPVAMYEKVETGVYFHVAGHIFRTNDEGIFEADRKDVAPDFITVANMIESGMVKFNDGALVMEVAGRQYKVEEKDEKVNVTMKVDETVTEFNIDQLRENNNYFVNAAPANQKAQRAMMLEGFAKVVENIDKIALLNNVSIIYNNNDRFLVIENNGNAYAKLLRTNRSQPWEVKGNIAQVVEAVKKYTHLDITKLYEQAIESAVKDTAAKEAQQVKENLEKEAIEQRKQKIAELTEKYKNDPTRLAMLSQVAEDLAKLDA